jgi:ferredoxin--NADP+ reductase
MAWVDGRIIDKRHWAPGLISLTLDVVVQPFAPGQFVNLSLGTGESRVKRSYSLASPAGQPSEFYLSLVEQGQLTPTLLGRGPGDVVSMEDRALGFFTLSHVPETRDLWMVATGTGLGPFMSMLRSGECFDRFERIVLAHGVRLREHLGYAEELSALARRRPDRFRYVPLVTRAEPPAGGLSGRAPARLRDRALERAAGVELSPDGSHVMLCGNPDMIEESRAVLASRGLKKHRKREPGHVTFESYW